MLSIKRISLNKAQYMPGDELIIEVQISEDNRKIFEGNEKKSRPILNCHINDLSCIIWHQEYILSADKYAFEVNKDGDNKGTDIIKIYWTVPEDLEFASFGIDLFLKREEKLLDIQSTGFDVVQKWSLAPRYGFLANFEPEKDPELIRQRISRMKDFHINLVQFYDWMYRHHQLLPESEEYRDIFDRPLSLKVVSQQISECRNYGMQAIAYGAVYGAEKDFVQEHPDWIAATRNKQGRNSLLDEHSEYIQIMNIAADCPWRKHIVNEYSKAIDNLNFSGIHMDQYGFPQTYYSVVDGKQELKDMGVEFGNLIDYSRRELGEETALIFNAVNNWPVEIVTDCPQDVVYIEVWSPHDTFYHLRKLILRARELSGYKKQVILAAYISSLNYKRKLPQEAGERSARLTAAAIFANGGFHLVMGEGSSMLTGPYYPEFEELSPSYSRVMQDYYDLITRYSKYLFRQDLRDRSEYLTGGINNEIKVKTADGELPIGPDGRQDTIWTIVKENKEFKVLNLINLMGIDTVDWDEPQYHDPKRLENLEVDWLIDEDIKAVYWITADGGDIRAKRLNYERVSHNSGESLRFIVPVLEYWSFLVIV